MSDVAIRETVPVYAHTGGLGMGPVARLPREKAGFAHEGTRVRGKKLDGEYDDVHIMGLIL